MKSIRILNPDITPKLGIIICSYKRYKRFYFCLKHLSNALFFAGIRAHIVIMDNAETDNLSAKIESYFINSSDNVMVTYVHYFGVNQSQLRNEGLSRVEESVKYLLYLDSDIYFAPKGIEYCVKYLDQHEECFGIAPPLGTYYGGKTSVRRKYIATKLNKGGEDLNMPTRDIYNRFQLIDNFLESYMMRGAYFLRRAVLIKYFDNKPFNVNFTVWQNVPFFLTVKELRLKVGYLLLTDAICLHDERKHKDTLKSKLGNPNQELLKSLIILFYRNSLWSERQQEINKRFIATISQVIEPITKKSNDDVRILYKVAKCLASSKKSGQRQMRDIQLNTTNADLKGAISLLLVLDWNQIKKIKSLKLSLEM